MKLGTLFNFLLIGASLIATACKYERFEPVNKNCATPLPEVVSFSKDIQPILNNNCNTANCHTGSAPEGNLNLDPAFAYNQITNPKNGYIDTLDPSSSLFYTQLISVNNPMPPSGKMDDCNIKMILKWIQQGVENN